MSSDVQISANKSEVEKRISAFIQRKRVAVDQLNRRSYFAQRPEGADTCARTDAVCGYGARKVTKVTNKDGPQLLDTGKDNKWDEGAPSCLPLHYGIEERLKTLEAHTGAEAGYKVQDVFERIKRVEDRLLQLESTSPEYLSFIKGNPVTSHHSSSHDEPNTADVFEEEKLPLDEIDQRILTLKKTLETLC